LDILAENYQRSHPGIGLADYVIAAGTESYRLQTSKTAARRNRAS
jgi:hypothetical protein